MNPSARVAPARLVRPGYGLPQFPVTRREAALLLPTLFLLGALSALLPSLAGLPVPEERAALDYFSAFERVLQGQWIGTSSIVDVDPVLAQSVAPFLPLENVAAVLWNSPFIAIHAIVESSYWSILLSTTWKISLTLVGLYLISRFFATPRVALVVTVLAASSQAVYFGYSYTQNSSALLFVGLVLQAIACSVWRPRWTPLWSLIALFGGIGIWVNATAALATLAFTIVLIALLAYSIKISIRALAGPLLVLCLTGLIGLPSLISAARSPRLPIEKLWIGGNGSLLDVAQGFGKWTNYFPACFFDNTICFPYDPLQPILMHPVAQALRLMIAAAAVAGLIWTFGCIRSEASKDEGQALRARVDARAAAALLTLVVGTLVFAYSGNIPAYWQLRAEFPQILMAFREPYAKWIPLYVVSTCLLLAFIAHQVSIRSTRRIRQSLLVAFATVSLGFWIVSIVPKPYAEGFAAPSLQAWNQFDADVQRATVILAGQPACLVNASLQGDFWTALNLRMLSIAPGSTVAPGVEGCPENRTQIEVRLQGFYSESDWRLGSVNQVLDTGTIFDGEHLDVRIPSS